MARLYIITVRWGSDMSPPSYYPGSMDLVRRTERVDVAAAGFGEWLRYNGDTWFVYSDKDAIEVSNRVRPALNQGDNLMVLPVDRGANLGGWAPKQVWEFILQRPVSGDRPTGLSALGGDTGPPGALSQYNLQRGSEDITR